jgi:hypothetical protein
MPRMGSAGSRLCEPLARRADGAVVDSHPPSVTRMTDTGGQFGPFRREIEAAFRALFAEPAFADYASIDPTR